MTWDIVLFLPWVAVFYLMFADLLSMKKPW